MKKLFAGAKAALTGGANESPVTAAKSGNLNLSNTKDTNSIIPVTGQGQCHNGISSSESQQTQQSQQNLPGQPQTISNNTVGNINNNSNSQSIQTQSQLLKEPASQAVLSAGIQEYVQSQKLDKTQNQQQQQISTSLSTQQQSSPRRLSSQQPGQQSTSKRQSYNDTQQLVRLNTGPGSTSGPNHNTASNSNNKNLKSQQKVPPPCPSPSASFNNQGLEKNPELQSKLRQLKEDQVLGPNQGSGNLTGQNQQSQQLSQQMSMKNSRSSGNINVNNNQATNVANTNSNTINTAASGPTNGLSLSAPKNSGPQKSASSRDITISAPAPLNSIALTKPEGGKPITLLESTDHSDVQQQNQSQIQQQLQGTNSNTINQNQNQQSQSLHRRNSFTGTDDITGQKTHTFNINIVAPVHDCSSSSGMMTNSESEEEYLDSDQQKGKKLSGGSQNLQPEDILDWSEALRNNSKRMSAKRSSLILDKVEQSTLTTDLKKKIESQNQLIVELKTASRRESFRAESAEQEILRLQHEEKVRLLQLQKLEDELKNTKLGAKPYDTSSSSSCTSSSYYTDSDEDEEEEDDDDEGDEDGNGGNRNQSGGARSGQKGNNRNVNNQSGNQQPAPFTIMRTVSDGAEGQTSSVVLSQVHQQQTNLNQKGNGSSSHGNKGHHHHQSKSKKDKDGNRLSGSGKNGHNKSGKNRHHHHSDKSMKDPNRKRKDKNSNLAPGNSSNNMFQGPGGNSSSSNAQGANMRRARTPQPERSSFIAQNQNLGNQGANQSNHFVSKLESEVAQLRKEGVAKDIDITKLKAEVEAFKQRTKNQNTTRVQVERLRNELTEVTKKLDEQKEIVVKREATIKQQHLAMSKVKKFQGLLEFCRSELLWLNESVVTGTGESQASSSQCDPKKSTQDSNQIQQYQQRQLQGSKRPSAVQNQQNQNNGPTASVSAADATASLLGTAASRAAQQRASNAGQQTQILQNITTEMRDKSQRKILDRLFQDLVGNLNINPNSTMMNNYQYQQSSSDSPRNHLVTSSNTNGPRRSQGGGGLGFSAFPSAVPSACHSRIVSRQNSLGKDDMAKAMAQAAATAAASNNINSNKSVSRQNSIGTTVTNTTAAAGAAAPNIVVSVPTHHVVNQGQNTQNQDQEIQMQSLLAKLMLDRVAAVATQRVCEGKI